MPPLPPLESLRFFEAAARRESFAKAAEELHVSSSAVAHRIKVLEKHLDGALFDRSHRSVRLNGRGKAYLKDVQRILAEIQVVTERRRGDSGTQRLKLVSVEAVAEKWLMPQLADFKVSHPGVVIELETNHRGVDPARRDFDIWLAYVGETAAPRPEGLFEETLYEENLLRYAVRALSRRAEGPATRSSCMTGPCCTISDGTPTGRTGSRARANRHRTSRGPRASDSTAWWSTPPSRAWGRLWDTRG